MGGCVGGVASSGGSRVEGLDPGSAYFHSGFLAETLGVKPCAAKA